jgi:hypothetical protein
MLDILTSYSSTDHRPVVLRVKPDRVLSDVVPVAMPFRQNFKSVRSADLEEAIERHGGLNKIYGPRDVNEVATSIVAGITRALDAIAPMEAIRARPGGNIYLSAETLRLMEERDSKRGISYKHLRNRVSSLVKRDKLWCNLVKLRKTPEDSKVLLNLATEALGKGRPSLPALPKKEDGSNTCGNQEAATTMNEFYIWKVVKLREKNEVNLQSTTDLWPPQRRTFEWTYVSAAKLTKQIRQLTPTEALGTDGILVSVLKKGVEVLTLPLAHLLNMSYTTGTVPNVFKNAKVHPLHKGGDKS